MTTRMRPAPCFALALILALGSLALSGCASDPVAPHDPNPTLNVTPDGAARAAGAMGWLVVRVGEKFLQDPATSGHIGAKTAYVLTGSVEGTCDLTFTNGTAAPWNLATHAALVTDHGPLVLHGASFDLAADFGLTFDLDAAINQTAHVATTDGSGTLVMGSVTVPWTVTGLMVPLGRYPTGGTLSATMGSLTAVVTFTGGSTASIAVGDRTYSLDLDTGEATLVP